MVHHGQHHSWVRRWVRAQYNICRVITEPCWEKVSVPLCNYHPALLKPVWDMPLIFKHAQHLQGELLNEPVSVTLADAQVEITVVQRCIVGAGTWAIKSHTMGYSERVQQSEMRSDLLSPNPVIYESQRGTFSLCDPHMSRWANLAVNHWSRWIGYGVLAPTHQNKSSAEVTVCERHRQDLETIRSSTPLCTVRSLHQHPSLQLKILCGLCTRRDHTQRWWSVLSVWKPCCSGCGRDYGTNY